MKARTYWKSIEAFKKDLRDAVPLEELKELHQRSGAHAPRLHGAAVRDRRRVQLRAVAPHEPAALGPGRGPPGLHVLQHDDAAPRGRAPLRLREAPAARRAAPRPPLRLDERHLGQPVHALAPRPPRQPRLVGGRPQAPLALAEAQRALVQAALLHARAHPDLLPRRGERGALVPARSCAARSRGSGWRRWPSSSASPRPSSPSAAGARWRACGRCRTSSSSRWPSR